MSHNQHEPCREVDIWERRVGRVRHTGDRKVPDRGPKHQTPAPVVEVPAPAPRCAERKRGPTRDDELRVSATFKKTYIFSPVEQGAIARQLYQ